MTIEEATEYVERAVEAEGEQFAEWGSGAVSLGYDAAEWAADYHGYRTSTDPAFAEAEALLKARYSTVRVTHWPRPVLVGDDVPF